MSDLRTRYDAAIQANRTLYAELQHERQHRAALEKRVASLVSMLRDARANRDLWRHRAKQKTAA